MYKWMVIMCGFVSLGNVTMVDLSAMASENATSRKAVIFDLNGVLVNTSMMEAARYLGRAKIGAYFLLEGKTPHSLKDLLYKVLDESPFGNNLQLCDPYGAVLPAVFCDIFKGHCTETECFENVKNTVIANKDRFTSHREYTLCLRVVDMIFNPEILISLQKIKQGTLKILRECRAKGHEIFIISNYGKESFDLLRKKLPEIFEGMDPEHLIISAHVQAVKPHKDIYEILQERLKLKGITPSPETCFVVDDQLENVHGVDIHNMKGIHFKNAHTLRSILKLHKVL